MVSKIIFSALRASVGSKNKGIRHCTASAANLFYCVTVRRKLESRQRLVPSKAAETSTNSTETEQCLHVVRLHLFVIVVVSLALSFHFPQILPQFRGNLISFIFQLA